MVVELYVSLHRCYVPVPCQRCKHPHIHPLMRQFCDECAPPTMAGYLVQSGLVAQLQETLAQPVRGKSFASLACYRRAFRIYRFPDDIKLAFKFIFE